MQEILVQGTATPKVTLEEDRVAKPEEESVIYLQPLIRRLWKLLWFTPFILKGAK